MQGVEYVIIGKNDDLEYVPNNKNEYDLKLKYIVFVPRNNTKEYGIVYFLDNKLYQTEVHHDF